MNLPGWLPQIPGEQPYPLVFATVSGAHLYGFPSRDSDVDLRGAHVLPLREVVGLRTGPETLDRTWTREAVEVDLVTHDLAKFCRLLLNRNGYVLEQLLSPLVVATSPAHAELTALAPGCLTRHHAHHYLGFARTQWRLFEKTGELKPLLYTFRVLATGTHLMRAGELVADLTRLFAYGPAYLPELVEVKREAEHGAAPPIEGVGEDVARMTAALQEAQSASALPETATTHDALNDLVIRRRLAS
ncbi:DNA polymerase beta superfamily protein [Nonomuraea sp. NPDC050790]|uniref:nucleotidyltransferase domain-containing protein n=1 Tax=Nonomuraea sp. NPDC050790 TaxID=3364371 RepID=UPI00378F1E86